MLYTKYQSFRPSRFREEGFWSLPSLFLCSNLWPPGRGQFWPLEDHLNKLDRGSLGDATHQISKLLPSFREEDFQRFCIFFPFSLQWQPELWMELNSLNNFCRASPKEHPYQVSSRLAQWFRRRCLKKLLTDKGNHNSSLWALCAQVS